MSASDFRFTETEIICALTGAGQLPELEPSGSFFRLNTQECLDKDAWGSDIGYPFDMRGDHSKTGYLFGDIIGTDLKRGYTSIFGAGSMPTAANQHRAISSGSVQTGPFTSVNLPQLATAFTGQQLDQIVVGSIGGFDPVGQINIQTGVGAGGYACFTYTGLATGPARFVGVKWISGGGTVTVGLDVCAGDPRTFFRGSLFGSSTDTDLSDGLTIAFEVDPAGTGIRANVAREALPFPGGNRYGSGRTFTSVINVGGVNEVELGYVYPRIGNPAHSPPWPVIGDFFGIVSITKAGNGYIDLETNIDHDLPLGAWPAPRTGSSLYIGGYSVVRQTACRGGVQDFDSLTTLNVVSTAGFYAGANAAHRKATVQTTKGWATISYTSITGGATPTLNGVVVLTPTGPAPKGKTITSGQVWQGCVYFSTSIDSSDFLIHSVPDARHIRANAPLDTMPSVGGDPSAAFLFLPYNQYIGAPQTAPRDGNITWGATSVAKTGSTGNRRQVAFSQATLWHGQRTVPIVACELWTSDNDGVTWTWRYAFENTEHFSSPVMGISPYLDAADVEGTGQIYVWSVCGPGNILARCLASDFAKTTPLKADWQFCDTPLTSPSWSSTIPSPATAKLFGSAPSNAISLYYHQGKQCWIMLYSINFDLVGRFAESIYGPWSAERLLVRYGDTGPVAGLPYGGFPHHLSEVAPEDDEHLSFVFTYFNPYNVYVARTKIYEPGEAATMSKLETQATRYASEAKLQTPELHEATYVDDASGWVTDSLQWNRTGGNTFEVLGDATSYLRKWMKCRVTDAGGVRYFHILSVGSFSGVTPITIIPHNNGDTAGSVFTAGAFPTGIGEYSLVADPEGWPGVFNYTPTIVGYDTPPASSVYTYSIRGKWMSVQLRNNATATNNATTAHTFSLPAGVAARTRTNAKWIGHAWVLDATSTLGILEIDTAGTTIRSYLDALTTNYRSTGTSAILSGSIEFELPA